MSKMNQKIKEKWVAALRSGEYLQTQGYLKQGGGHCCLGVLCDIVDPEGWSPPKEAWDGSNHRRGKSDEYDPKNTGYLPDARKLRVGLSTKDIHKLAELNDEEELSFPKIADYIEENL